MNLVQDLNSEHIFSQLPQAKYVEVAGGLVWDLMASKINVELTKEKLTFLSKPFDTKCIHISGLQLGWVSTPFPRIQQQLQP